MNHFKETITKLQDDTLVVLHRLDTLRSSNSLSPSVIEHGIDNYLCEIETLCIRSRILLDGYRQANVVSDCYTTDGSVSKIAGNAEVTLDGWLHITLGTLLPNCRRRSRAISVIR